MAGSENGDFVFFFSKKTKAKNLATSIPSTAAEAGDNAGESMMDLTFEWNSLTLQGPSQLGGVTDSTADLLGTCYTPNTSSTQASYVLMDV